MENVCVCYSVGIGLLLMMVVRVMGDKEEFCVMVCELYFFMVKFMRKVMYKNGMIKNINFINKCLDELEVGFDIVLCVDVFVSIDINVYNF